jgi:hypothetical protein
MPMTPHRAAFHTPLIACSSGSPLREITIWMPCQVRPATSRMSVSGNMKLRSCCAGPIASLHSRTQSPAPGSACWAPLKKSVMRCMKPRSSRPGHRSVDGISTQELSSFAIQVIASATDSARPSRMPSTTDPATDPMIWPGTPTMLSMTLPMTGQLAGANGLHMGEVTCLP